MGDVQRHFHLHQTLLSQVLCVLVHDHADTRFEHQVLMILQLMIFDSCPSNTVRIVMILQRKPSRIHPCFTLKIGHQAYRCETSNIGQCFSFIVQPLYIDDVYSALSGIMDLVVKLMDLLWMSEYIDVFNMTVV